MSGGHTDGETTMTSETKTPQPGEWWLYNTNPSCRRFIIGMNNRGHIVGQAPFGEYEVFDGRGNMALEFWHHEPRCDGFGWTEPPAIIDPGDGWELLPVGTIREEGDQLTRDRGESWEKTVNEGFAIHPETSLTYRRRKPAEWPKYYRGERWSDADAYVRFDNADCEAVWVMSDGREKVFAGNRFNSVPQCIKEYSWVRLTEAEALARVTKPEPELCSMCGMFPVIPGTAGCRECTKWAIETSGCPVKSPEDWVEITDENHMPRDGVDWFNGGSNESWIVHEPRHVRSTLGQYKQLRSKGRFRCRRRDLPNIRRIDTEGRDVTQENGLHDESDTIVQRIPVRLWRDKESGQIVATIPEDVYCVGDFAVEVMHDADGFYVTEGER